MKDKIIVIGGGGHAQDVISTLKTNNEYEIIGYTDLRDKGEILGINYLGTDDVLEDVLIKYKKCNAAIGFGNIEVSNKRRFLFYKLKQMGFLLPVIISKGATINEKVFIDEGSIIMDKAIVNVYSKIGKGSIINFGTIIGHSSMIGNFVHVSGGTIIAGGVEIGDNCVIGIGSKIIQNIKIVSNCLLGAGSVIIKDILKPGTYFGIPARKVNID